jgi:hypothetical protein
MSSAKAWRDLWNSYQHNRIVAMGFGHFNKCAVVMSATIGVKPSHGEKSLADLDSKELDASIRKERWLRDYFIRAQELANRLEKKWGTPLKGAPTLVAKRIAGKRGFIFFVDAYKGGIDHIDLYDGQHIGCRLTTDGQPNLTGPSDPFKTAKRIWFWSH